MALDSRIYLDNNSTTVLDPEVLDAMQFDLCNVPRNPSCIHSFGRDARNELIRAKRVIADAFEVSSEEIYFSSGATESNNFLLKGFLKKIFPKTVITTKLEHSSIFRIVEEYQKNGGDVCFLPVDKVGAPKLDDLKKVIGKQTGLLTLMAVNNETGVKTDYESFAQLAKEHNVPFVIDGVALLGKEPFKVVDGISAVSFSGHKLHAPKGIGITYLSDEFDLDPLIIGGNQQNSMRAGTHNLSGILGFSKAIELLQSILPHETLKMQKMRDRFEKTLQEKLENVLINGEGNRICNTSSIAFLGCDGESLLMSLDMQGVAASHGSACSSGSLAPSRILSAMGYPKERVESSIRFSISRFTTDSEIDRAIAIIVDVVKQMRNL
ncbi:MAG: Cysteine desulfurase NifS [Chlamydiae bacterium]|nr:Cysteine desulfurase NifS [Chlamydiota bacterium]